VLSVVLLLAATTVNAETVLQAVGEPASPSAHSERPAPRQVGSAVFRGVYFNPQVHPDPTFPWLLHYPIYRTRIRTALTELVGMAGINLVDIFVLIPNTLLYPGQGPRAGQPLEEWANISYLDNLATFIDDCQKAGVSVQLDMANNMWIPYSIDSETHLAQPGGPWWPVADETPWDESATWCTQVINYTEKKAAHPENIAMWCMMGNYQLGSAEPLLWDRDDVPAVTSYTERFVKNVWPAFRTAGQRPKAAPIFFPILSDDSYWMAKTPKQRLSGLTNLKKWLVDDLALPPDYWVMTTYPFCDPAPDGFRYLQAVIETLGAENARRIVSTDLKGPGHDDERHDSIIAGEGRSGTEMLEWHFRKCTEYGFAGWWIWAYQDTPSDRKGIRCLDGRWKLDLVQTIKHQASTR
jgi:hypothetical protein